MPTRAFPQPCLSSRTRSLSVRLCRSSSGVADSRLSKRPMLTRRLGHWRPMRGSISCSAMSRCLGVVADIAAICRQNGRQLDSPNFPSHLKAGPGLARLAHGSFVAMRAATGCGRGPSGSGTTRGGSPIRRCSSGLRQALARRVARRHQGRPTKHPYGSRTRSSCRRRRCGARPGWHAGCAGRGSRRHRTSDARRSSAAAALWACGGD